MLQVKRETIGNCARSGCSHWPKAKWLVNNYVCVCLQRAPTFKNYVCVCILKGHEISSLMLQSETRSAAFPMLQSRLQGVDTKAAGTRQQTADRGHQESNLTPQSEDRSVANAPRGPHGNILYNKFKKGETVTD
jgi:hypothetical protein